MGDDSNIILILALTAVVSAAAGGFIATTKGRAGGEGFLLGLLFGPFGLLVEALLPTLPPQAPLDSGHAASVAQFNPPLMSKKCPDCAESIKLEARVCRYCGARFSEEALQLALEEAKATHQQVPSDTPPSQAIVAECVVCRAPLTHSARMTLKGKSYCLAHFDEIIS